MTVHAPFTAEQVENLNEWQQSGLVHEFTCGSGNRTDEKHLDRAGVLVATEAGWHCPFCDYKQDWAHDFMADGSLLKLKCVARRTVMSDLESPLGFLSNSEDYDVTRVVNDLRPEHAAILEWILERNQGEQLREALRERYSHLPKDELLAMVNKALEYFDSDQLSRSRLLPVIKDIIGRLRKVPVLDIQKFADAMPTGVLLVMSWLLSGENSEEKESNNKVLRQLVAIGRDRTNSIAPAQLIEVMTEAKTWFTGAEPFDSTDVEGLGLDVLDSPVIGEPAEAEPS